MSRILIFAGTTEGRRLAEILEANKCPCDACVATEYGSQLLKSTEYVTVHEGRLDKEGMQKLYRDIACDIVVDATHPYAEIVTATIRESLEGLNIRYIRLKRPSSSLGNDCDNRYKSASDCVESLLNTEGRILLTTGSKDLKAFADTDLKERLMVRVLPGMDSLKLCYEAGLEGKQIIAMQGPFSKEMNQATLKQYKIEHLVTKESGHQGGFDEKLAAAAELGVRIHVIERPGVDTADESGMTLSETINTLCKLTDISINRPSLKIALIGIGCGRESLLTCEAKEYIEDASYLFGAERMLDSVNSSGKKYPFYLKEDILPKLAEIYESDDEGTVAVLFSGDTGFYSGAAKLFDALKNDNHYKVEIMPGISSVSYLSAKTGVDWGRAKLLSIHGKQEEEWLSTLIAAVEENHACISITSGAKDIRKIGECLSDKKNIEIILGYNLSYPDEEIKKISPAECKEVEKEGLYACVIINEKPDKATIVPCIRDDEFIRDKVPMTKEAVRELSICKLGIRQGDVIYDIGSGTGSISVQIAKLSNSLRVYAIESNEDAVKLIESNISKFGIHNVTTINTMAPDGLSNLETADCAFIGGSRGKLKEILDKLYEINSSMRIVINAVSMESITEVYSILNDYTLINLDITQANISTAKKLGDYNLMQANNPVFIFSFEFC